MSVVVTGATGHLGRLVVESLLERGVPADQIVAGGRKLEKLADLAERGVVVRTIDYDDPATLKDAFTGADRVLLVSGNEFGSRPAQHQAVVDAAKDAGVGHLVYTSILHAGSTGNPIAPEHEATEAAVLASGLPYTLLRNGWYHENYTAQLPGYLANGVVGATGEGRIDTAARADYAAAAAAVLTGDGHQGQTYELAGDSGFTLAELAAEVSRQSGQEVGHVNLSEAALAELLQNAAGMPAPVASTFAGVDTAIANGDLADDSRTLSRLIGRPTTPISDAIATALAAG
jgi:NAD(P)H dehydrogenase (quinone)